MLSVKELTKNYPQFRLNCTLEIPKGRITGLVGPNGAGKTTLFRLILGLAFPDSGEMTVFGQDGRKLSSKDRQRIGTVLAESGFSGYLTAEDVRVMLKNFYDGFDAARFKESCRRLGIPTDKKIKDFSTGMKAKLKTLAALSHGADFLLLDEPTAGLDVIARDEVLDMLREYMEEDDERSILISSHISSDLEHICDDLYLIKDGTIRFHEDTDRLLSEYAVLKVPENEIGSLDDRYIIARMKAPFGYSCLTAEGQYFRENYPGLVIEKTGIDDLMQHIIKAC